MFDKLTPGERGRLYDMLLDARHETNHVAMIAARPSTKTPCTATQYRMVAFDLASIDPYNG